jgi:hypothetical protein
VALLLKRMPPSNFTSAGLLGGLLSQRPPRLRKHPCPSFCWGSDRKLLPAPAMRGKSAAMAVASKHKQRGSRTDHISDSACYNNQHVRLALLCCGSVEAHFAHKQAACTAHAPVRLPANDDARSEDTKQRQS